MTDHANPKSSALTESTIRHYDENATAFWEGTRDHDVSQNTAALLDALHGTAPFKLLDFGCGPGRDLQYFRDLGHEPVGLDGSENLAALAREHSGADVWVQDFTAPDLPEARFDGIFANASLFHVPRSHIEAVLATLRASLVPGGVLFASMPRGNDDEGFAGARYGVYYKDETWLTLVEKCGFEPIRHYYRPDGAPRDQQRWLASVWRNPTL
jgi:SAM-dependent methyltransferase